MDSYLSFFMDWIDVLWIPIALFVVHKKQRVKAVLFILACMFCLRLQAEIIQSTGFKSGFTGLLESDVFHRGLIFYSICISIYLLLSYISPNTKGAIYMAASLSLFFMAFIGSMVLMVL